MSMKVKCDFCKTEYMVDDMAASVVQCAVCGHRWSVTGPSRRNTWLMFFASLCALLSAIIFTIAVITQHQARTASRGPLVASVSSVESTTDSDGVPHVVVGGSITNISDDIYGVPDLMIVFMDSDGRVLGRQKFMPSATLLDAGGTVRFSHVLSALPAGTKTISAELSDLEIPVGDKK